MPLKSFAAVTFGVAAVAFGIVRVRTSVHVDAFKAVCQIVQDKFYLDNEELAKWGEDCLKQARAPSPAYGSRSRLLSQIQDQLDQLHASHLQIYDPPQEKRLWTGRGLDTGLRTHWVEDHLITYRVVPESAADRGGLRVGDEIILFNRQRPRSPWQLMSQEGWLVVERLEQKTAKQWQVALRPEVLSEDLNPKLFLLNSMTGQLQIESFRSQYFEKQEWLKIVTQAQPLAHLIVDLRNNSGGNFVAMLRVLSSFFCGAELIGRLEQPRKNLADAPELPDDLSDDLQIQIMDSHRHVALRTYNNYGCLRMPVTVLTNYQTASVAEIFAAAISRRAKTRIWGQPTAGDVLLAVWYALPILGPGYSLSVPEANFVLPSGTVLEGSGWWPQRELRYDLNESRLGIDTWLKEAQQIF